MKAKYWLFIVPLLCLMAACGCGSGNRATTETLDKVTETPGAANVVVLCDVSGSVSLLGTRDTAGLVQRTAAMLKGCSELIRHYPPGSMIRFYLIGSNAFEHPFMELQQPEVYQLNQDEIIESFEQADKRIKHVIDSALRSAENNTCILTSVENAYRSFRQMSREAPLAQNELIIFSDMVEQCEDSPAGHVMMDQRPGRPLLNTKDSSLLATYQGDESVQKTIINIRICMTTPYMPVSVAHNIQKAWTGIFSRMGSKQAASGDLIFESTAAFNPYKNYVVKE
ncbi:hypothetical protein [Mucilaginibacter sp. AK015]|uniref:hypothetical protein n=1 Tax=Mucilaginibacter sp. AK015 TaxID=2723072 RepID=UPI001621147F|nr:hypothetical protein [Mucilaginibacter sp. AK015]MBB5395065.1 hypothetical protein [Mucilaginibacter sp. AK015]